MKSNILIFGAGPLQESIIERCKLKGLYTIGIDPLEDAYCRDKVDIFEVVGGQDYLKTIEIAKKYNIDGIVTASTDKPLVMMAKVAKELNLPFFSVETAKHSTDKFFMKKKFQEYNILCAKGLLLKRDEDFFKEELKYPVILKPRDNSGSRGVVYCVDKEAMKRTVDETFDHTKKDSILVEEYIEGKEYSVESIHYNGESKIIQITEKVTTSFPYNVETAHIQPYDCSDMQKHEIKETINNIAKALNFENCASHIEIKINTDGVYVIEASPRLGGDFISSTLVPLSTGINMEDLVIDIALGNDITFPKIANKASSVLFFHCTPGLRVTESFFIALDRIRTINGVVDVVCNLDEGEKFPYIRNSLNRYGHVILKSESKTDLLQTKKKIKEILKRF